MKVLWVEVAESGIARTYSLVVGMFAVFLTARTLGPDGQGVVAAATAWVTLFASFAGLSLGQIVQYRIQLRKDKNWLPASFGTLVIISVFFIACGYLTAWLLYILTGGESFQGISGNILSIAFLMLPLIIWEEYARHLLAATGKLRYYNLILCTGRTIWLLFVIVLVCSLKLGIGGAFASQIAGQSIIVFSAIKILLKETDNKVRFSRVEIGETLKGAAKLHLNTVGAYLLAQNSILILNHFLSKSEVGYYQIAYYMVMCMNIIPQATSIVLFSKMARIDPNTLWPEQKRLGKQMILIMATISIIAYFIVPFIFPLIVGNEYDASIKIFRAMLPIVLGMTVIQVMTSQWIGRGAFLATTFATFTVAIANIIANVLLIPKYGVMGAVWGNIICYLGIGIIVQGYFIWWCEKQYRKTVK